jgi:hypothetical protein
VNWLYEAVVPVGLLAHGWTSLSALLWQRIFSPCPISIFGASGLSMPTPCVFHRGSLSFAGIKQVRNFTWLALGGLAPALGLQIMKLEAICKRTALDIKGQRLGIKTPAALGEWGYR